MARDPRIQQGLSNPEPVRRYPLRAALLLVLAVGGTLTALALRYRHDDSAALFEIVAQLDLFHDLFYAMLPASALILLVPRIGQASRSRLLISAPLCLILAGLAAWLPLDAARLARPSVALFPWPLPAAALIALNLFAICWVHLNGLAGSGPVSRMQRLYGLADLLVPALVWAAYRQGGGPRRALWRPIPALVVGLFALLPWLFAPHPIDSARRFHPALQLLREPPCYQVQVDPADGGLLATTDESVVFRLDPRSGAELASCDTGLQTAQSMALDSRLDRLFIANPAVGRSLELDRRTLRIVQDIAVLEPLQIETNKWRTIALPDQGLIGAYSMNYFALLDPRDGRIAALRPDAQTTDYLGGYSDALYLRSRRELLVTVWDLGRLVALDPATLAETRSLATPLYPERMAYDPQTGRLFVTLPLPGQIMVVDLERFEEIARIDAFPGVRVIAADSERRRLYLGGFSPLLEIHSLDDWSLIDRIPAPAWMRWIAVDGERGAAYFCSGWFGIFRADLKRLGAGDPAAARRRIDPFYTLVGATSRWVQRVIWPATSDAEAN